MAHTIQIAAWKHQVGPQPRAAIPQPTKHGSSGLGVHPTDAQSVMQSPRTTVVRFSSAQLTRQAPDVQAAPSLNSATHASGPGAAGPLQPSSSRLLSAQTRTASQSLPGLRWEALFPQQPMSARSTCASSAEAAASPCAESEGASASKPNPEVSQPPSSGRFAPPAWKPGVASSQGVPQLHLEALLSQQPLSARCSPPPTTPADITKGVPPLQLEALGAQQPQCFRSPTSPVGIGSQSRGGPRLPTFPVQQPPSRRSARQSLSSPSTLLPTKPTDSTGQGESELSLEDAASARVERLFAVMGKGDAETDQHITVRDVLQHIRAVQSLVPELLSEFPKIDQGSSGKITATQLESYLSPSEEAEFGRERLQQIWERLTSGREEQLAADRLFLNDLARHYDFASTHVSALVERFHEVDTDHSCSIERTEFDAFFGNGEAWLEAKLAGIIGLDTLKEQLKTFYWATKLDRLRRQAGTFVKDDEPCVLLFKGNPGVGKTTVARLVTGMLHKIGIIPSDTFVEVQRDQLVGDHIGATEKATEDAIAKAKGGVLFVDEAYRLSVDAFGVEAINCLMRAMTEKGNVIILAGYPEQMDEFISINPGIKRRITFEFAFLDYSVEDLAHIFRHQVSRRGFEIANEATVEQIASLIERGTTQDQRRTLNGGVGEHVCRHAIFHLNRRQIELVRSADRNGMQDPHVSIVLEMEDIEYGCSQVPS